MKTRIIYFAMFFVFVSNGIFAQQEKSLRIHQVGINFSSLNSFGLHYKTGGEKTLLRLSLLSLNLGQNSNWGRAEDSLDIKQISYGAGFRLGFEKRIPVYAKLDFRWGLEAGVNWAYNKQKSESLNGHYENTDWRFSPMVNAILGVTYTIADHLVIGAEITPGIQYSYGKSIVTAFERTIETTYSSVGFGFSNSFASLSIAYQFGK
jgi:hypothetical protein